MEGDALPFKDRGEDFALVKKAGFLESPAPPAKVDEPSSVSEVDATAEDVRKLLASDAILPMGDENLADVDVGDLDSAFATMSDVRKRKKKISPSFFSFFANASTFPLFSQNISHMLKNYGD